ncbi:45118_t:CDS:2, partial [Gigaspora margarita]
YSALLELLLDLLVPVSPRSHTFMTLPELSNINFSDLLFPINPVLLGLSLNLTSLGPSEPININSSFDFLLLLVRVALPSDLIKNDIVNNGIMTNTDLEKSKNSVNFLLPPVRIALE